MSYAQDVGRAWFRYMFLLRLGRGKGCVAVPAICLFAPNVRAKCHLT